MSKIWAIAYKDMYGTFSDRNLLIIMFAAPIVLSTIIGLAFGGGGSSSTGSFADIPIAIVNMDEAVEQNGQTVAYGQQLTDIITGNFAATPADNSQPACSLVDEEISPNVNQPTTSLTDLFNTTVLEDEATARAGVESGDYHAAILIPPDFTTNLTGEISVDFASFFGGGDTEEIAPLTPARLEVYANSGQQITSSIARSVAEGIVNQLATGSIAINATINTMIRTPETATAMLGDNADAFAVFGCGFMTSLNSIGIERVPVDESQQLSPFAQIIVQIGSAQAVFFGMFTGVFGILNIYEERKDGTLQRLLVSPTPRSYILAGKILGNLLVVFLQIVVLLIALLVIVSLLEGTVTLIWGTNLLAILLIVVTLVFCVSGIGVLVVSVVKTPEQAQVVGPMVNTGLALLGGAFGFQLPSVVAQFSPIYWGVDAFTKLSQGNSDIGLNIVVLAAMGVGLFVIGLWLFNRRAEV